MSYRNLSKYTMMNPSTFGLVSSTPAKTTSNNRCNDPESPNRWQ
jgi:hypothetical protein